MPTPPPVRQPLGGLLKLTQKSSSKNELRSADKVVDESSSLPTRRVDVSDNGPPDDKDETIREPVRQSTAVMDSDGRMPTLEMEVGDQLAAPPPVDSSPTTPNAVGLGDGFEAFDTTQGDLSTHAMRRDSEAPTGVRMEPSPAAPAVVEDDDDAPTGVQHSDPLPTDAFVSPPAPSSPSSSFPPPAAAVAAEITQVTATGPPPAGTDAASRSSYPPDPAGEAPPGAEREADDEDDPPTYRRDPPKKGSVPPPRPPDEWLADDDDEVDTNVREPAGTVVVVNGATPDQRLEVPILRLTDTHLYCVVYGEAKRFSRAAGYEHPPGGAWSTWRLSGKSHNRWRVGRK